MKIEWIKVFGAREHNLKNIDVAIPKGALTVITGPSGSGKSSLALDILFTEGKRRYMESLSSYARQFLGTAKKPEIDRIDGLCPSIAIEQKTVSNNPRSTVGTVTEIYDYLRVLFARIGVVHCPDCMQPISAESPDAITVRLLERFAGNMVTVAAPYAIEQKGEFVKELSSLFQAGLYRFIIDGQQHRFASVDQIHELKLQKTKKHSIDILIDALEVTHDERARLQEAIEKAFQYAQHRCKIIVGTQDYIFSSERMCVRCGISIPEVEPRIFSFNSPLGACSECHGLGVVHEWPWSANDPENWKSEYLFFADKYAKERTCRRCHGRRLNEFALAVTIGDKTIYDVSAYAIKDLLVFFATLTLDEVSQEIGATLIKEISERLTFLKDVGLGYLTLNRASGTLSGGEGQRIRLATQIGSALSGVLYILDEPSIGLHQRDNDRLIDTLKKLRDLDNTVVVVEHDTDTMLQADYIIDMGPGAGVQGGRVTAVGTPEQLKKNPDSLTGAYLSGRRKIEVPQKVRAPSGFMTLRHANKNNLKDLTVQFPLGVLCGISGVSGSGKSSLIMQELVPLLERELTRSAAIGNHDTDLQGIESLESMVVIDQKPIGRTPRSNPATYLGIFDDIRKLFASLPESNARGYTVGRFSFNVPEGRCSTCKGDGTVTVEMHFLPEVVMECKTCKGKRYNQETLQIMYKNKTIADVLEMTALEAHEFFAAHKNIAKRLQLLSEVGLDYLKLGQPSTTLSGGEAQRIKLVDELAKRGSDTLYILDEPTTGLHSNDIEKLLGVLNRLIDKGNSMIVIEHNLDVLKTADYIIDMGPEGGDEGGAIVVIGTPAVVAACAASHTGRYLKHLLG
jgi:excinuclease ABC subunit A